MSYTLEFFINAWTEARNMSSIGDSYSKIDLWNAYWDYISHNYLDKTEMKNGFHSNIVKLLKDDGAFDNLSSILDVGCGPGSYTIPFALNGGKHITALDCSKGMLEVLDRRAKEIGVFDKINIVENLWEDYKSNERFDLVFSSLSPAVCDYDGLVKMESFSKNYCCLVSFANGTRSMLRSSLWKQLSGKEMISLTFDIIYPFNILYAQGKCPNLKFYHFKSEPIYTIKEALENYIIYYKIFGFEGKKYEIIIKDYLNKIADAGKVYDSLDYHLGVMWWNNK